MLLNTELKTPESSVILALYLSKGKITQHNLSIHALPSVDNPIKEREYGRNTCRLP